MCLELLCVRVLVSFSSFISFFTLHFARCQTKFHFVVLFSFHSHRCCRFCFVFLLSSKSHFPSLHFALICLWFAMLSMFRCDGYFKCERVDVRHRILCRWKFVIACNVLFSLSFMKRYGNKMVNFFTFFLLLFLLCEHFVDFVFEHNHFQNHIIFDFVFFPFFALLDDQWRRT